MFPESEFVQLIPGLRRFAIRLVRDLEAADDLLQSALLRAWEYRMQFDVGTNLFSWTARIMYSLHITATRRQKLVAFTSMDAMLRDLPGAAPELALEARETLRMLDAFQAPQRGALLWIGLGYSVAEVSEFTSTPAATVLTRASRARIALRRQAA